MLGVIAPKKGHSEDKDQYTVDGKVEWCKEPEGMMVLLSHWINKPWNCSTSELLVKWDNKMSLLFKIVDLDFLLSVAQTILIDTHSQVGSDSQSCV